MKLVSTLAIAFTALIASNFIAGCGQQAKMERCKFVEIDAEGGEVEMVCGDKIVDVPWNQFQRELRVNPERYINNLEAFKR